MEPESLREAKQRFVYSAVAMLVILVMGTLGYSILTGGKGSFLDCMYMTVITVTTIGYSEVFDFSAQPAGRIFTMFIAMTGIGTLAYVMSNVTAFIVEGELSASFRRRKMEKAAAQMQGHLIVCGYGSLGTLIVHELVTTKRPCVVIDDDGKSTNELARHGIPVVIGDATDADTLARANVQGAAGVFAAVDDDHDNVIITLTARQLNPRIKVVARCHDPKNVAKLKAVGADSTVSPTSIGALRMASEMVRPTVVGFLDMMLRDKDLNLRIEEIPGAPARLAISELGLTRFPNTLLLAVRKPSGWTFNPALDYKLETDAILVVMTTPDERARVADHLKSLA
jgi:voltage-gated potassium channel